MVRKSIGSIAYPKLLTRALCTSALLVGLTGMSHAAHPGGVLSSDLTERTETLDMGVVRLDYGRPNNDALVNCPYDTEPTNTPGGALVGFQHTWDEQLLGDCDTVAGYEIFASADVEALKTDGALVVQRARLLYKESPALLRAPWTANDTCVGGVVGVSDNWFDSDEGPPVYDAAASRTGPAEWDVTGLVRSWFTGSAGQSLLLRGHFARDGHQKDNAACVSALNDVRLEVRVLAEEPIVESRALPSELVEIRPAADSNRLPGDLIGAPTATSTPRPVERDKQDVDTDILVYKSPTPTHMLPHEVPKPAPDPGFTTKPDNAQTIRSVTSTPTQTPEPMVVPKPRSGIVQ
jgi:hypothetical protein